jgi:hypothetical protein
LAALGNVLLREDREFHTIQTMEGAFRQHALLRDAGRSPRPGRRGAVLGSSCPHRPVARADVSDCTPPVSRRAPV